MISVVETTGPLIIGADGMIGRALFDSAVAKGLKPFGTSRRANPRAELGYRVDLARPNDAALPYAPVAYICAGIVGYKNCEGNPASYRVNVDGTIAVAKRLVRDGAFIVFMSSDAAECMSGTAYGLHKALAEIYMQTITEPAIVRAGRIESHMLPALCDLLLDVGQNKRPGIFHFVPESIKLKEKTSCQA